MNLYDEFYEFKCFKKDKSMLRVADFYDKSAKNNEPESYYANIKGKPFTAVAYYYDKKWWWYSTRCADLLAEYGCSITDAVDKGIEIVAWAPLPPPYEDCNR